MGIGALLGGMGAQQRGGSFLKGALTGAALGGATGYLGGKFGGLGAAGTTEGGIFGFGKKMLPNFLAMSGIGMGTEMFGQQEANLAHKLGQQRWRDEEEERRLSKLSEIAGYNVADPSRFLTPDKFFGRAARGGYQSRPHYQLAGPVSMDDDPANAVNVQELQMDTGSMGPGEMVEEFDYMEAGSGGDESGWYEMFFNEFGRPPVDTNELELFIDQMDISPTDVARGAGQGPMMAARGGRVQMRGGGTPDDYDDDDIRYDEDLIDILENDGAMFHADYDIADEWKEGGIATVPRQNFLLGGLGVALAKLGRKGKASDALKDVYERNMGAIDQDQEGIVADTGEGSGFEELKTWAEGEDDKPSAAAPLWMLKDWVNKQKEKEEGLSSFDDLKEWAAKEAEGEDTGTKGKFRGISEDILKSLLLGPLGKIFNQKNPRLMELMGEDYEFEPGPAFSHLPMNRAQGGDVNRPGMFLGGGLGLGALLGGAGLLGKLFGGRGKGRREDIKAAVKKEAPVLKLPRPILDDEEDLPVHALLGAAEGGIADLDLRGGGASFGPGTGTSDDIPAMLSDGEFVVTANAVQNLGGGDRMLGAQRMYRMMNQLDPNSQAPSEISGIGYA